MGNRAIKYRVYPTTEQAILFAKTFGCCRKVYNLMLADKLEGYQATGKFPTVTPAKYKSDYRSWSETSKCWDCKSCDTQRIEDGLRLWQLYG